MLVAMGKGVHGDTRSSREEGVLRFFAFISRDIVYNP